MKIAKQNRKVIQLSDHDNRKSAFGSSNDYPKIISITSGKGGVGKTNIVANLGFSLQCFGKKVLIFDADLGLGNLDVLLGLRSQFNVSHVLKGEKSLSDIVLAGPGGMRILPAASGIQNLTALSAEEHFLIFSQLEEFVFEFDFMLIDTAAGISENVLYFNINSDEILVVATPDPTSIIDAYALMKVLSVKYGKNRFNLVINAAVDCNEAEVVFRQINHVAARFLNISMEYYGCIVLDEAVKKGVRQQRAIVESAPLSDASKDIIRLAHRIADSPPPIRTKRTRPWGFSKKPW